MSLSRSTFVAVLVLALVRAFPARGQTPETRSDPRPPGRSRVADLGFMAGCWRGVTPSGTTIEEFYSGPSANLVVGATRYVRDGRAVDFEFTRIDQTDSGAVLTPQPKGVRSVSFAPKVVGPNRTVWENSTHDFPQRIMYTRVSEDSLIARIEGRTPAGERALEWRMGRVTCEARPRVP
jgi:Domain of unknown function (DUF6265)